MNQISDEIGERHEKKYKSVESQSSRLVQIMAACSILIFLLLVSFILTCRANAKKKHDEDEDEVVNKRPHTSSSVDKAD